MQQQMDCHKNKNIVFRLLKGYKQLLLKLLNQIPANCLIKPGLCIFKCRFKCHRNICFVNWWAKFTTVRNCCLGIFMTFMTNGTCNGSLSWDWIFSDNDRVHGFAFSRTVFLHKCSLPRCLWQSQVLFGWRADMHR